MTKIHKETKKSKAVKKQRSEKYVRPERHIKRVDFQKIEEAPSNQFEQQIQRKIAVMPNASELLIKEEEKALFAEAVDSIPFSDLENKCLRLTCERLTPTEIGSELGIRDTSVHWYLAKAVRKIRAFLKKKHRLEVGQS